MVGFLNLMVGGALKGAGDAMVDKAKADREAAITALAETNKRTDMATQQDYQSQNIEHTGQVQGGLEDKRISGEKDIANLNITAADKRTDKDIAARHADVATEQAGASGRTGLEVAGRHQDVDTTTNAQVKVAGIRAAALEDRAKMYADRVSGGKPLTPGQALLAARATYKDAYAAGDSSLEGVTAKEWIDNETNRLMRTYGQKGAGGGNDLSSFDTSTVTGGGLMNPLGASPSASAIPSTPASGAPAVAPPIGAVDMLQKNPNLAPYFDQKYGQGASAAALGK